MMECYRTDFEDWGDAGVFTQTRRRDLSWGFYPYPRGVRRDMDRPLLHYDRLGALEVLEAIQLMQYACSMPANQTAVGEEVPEKDQGRGEPHGE